MTKALTKEDAAPCMDCGSVQCAFCGEKVRAAVEKRDKEFIENYLQKLSIAFEFGRIPYPYKKADYIIKLLSQCLKESRDKWFSGVIEK